MVCRAQSREPGGVRTFSDTGAGPFRYAFGNEPLVGVAVLLRVLLHCRESDYLVRLISVCMQESMCLRGVGMTAKDTADYI